MNRREFLQAKKSHQTTSSNITFNLPPPNALDVYTGPWTTQTVQHLLHRTMFGAKKEDIIYFLSKTVSEAVDELLTVSADPPPVLPPDYGTQAWQLNLTAAFQNGQDPYGWMNMNPPPPVNDYNVLIGGYSNDFAVPKGMPWIASSSKYKYQNTEYNGSHCNWARYCSFEGWWANLIIHQQRNIREKMVYFWYNHFSMRLPDDGQHYFKMSMYWNNARIRHQCMGNFKNLAKTITTDNMMLVCLNGHSNQIGGINENYAREFQELFTVGLPARTSTNNINSFTEDDVHQAARVLTGWQAAQNGIPNDDINPEVSHFWLNGVGESTFYTWAHDTGNKQFSSFYNNTIIQGQSGPSGGEQELDAFLDMIFAKEEVSKHICRELYRYFVFTDFAYDPFSADNSPLDLAIEQNVIEPLATIFRANNYELQPVLSTLFKSSHFFEVSNIGGMIKSPLDFLAGIAREFNQVFPFTVTPDSTIIDVNIYRAAIQGYLGMVTGARLGQYYPNIPSVIGWEAYTKSPYDRNWINGALYDRRNEIPDVLFSAYPNNFSVYRLGWNVYVDLPSYHWYAPEINLIERIELLQYPYDVNAVVSEICESMFPIPIDPCVKSQLKLYLLAGENHADYTWTLVWAEYVQHPENEDNTNTLKTRLRNFFTTLCKIEEYHLM